jgi:protein-S-isoprenylcysteine O-methyltransferase Ste14
MNGSLVVWAWAARFVMVVVLVRAGDPVSLFLALGEAVALVLAAGNAMRRDVVSDRSRLAVVVPVLYLLGSLVFPAPGDLYVYVAPVMLVVIALHFACRLWLGWSYSIGGPTYLRVVDGGPYRVVRHPQHALTLVERFLYCLAHPHPINAVGFVLDLARIFVVVRLEERFLLQQPAYRHYTRRVPARLIPRVW